MEARFYIGYNSLEDFIAHANPDLPVYLSLVFHEARGPYGIPIRYGEIWVFQIRDGLAHYWLFRAATAVGHDPKEKEKRAQAAYSALDRVKDILVGHGFSLIPATVAVPRDLRLMQADTGLLRFDKERGEYVLAKPEAE